MDALLSLGRALEACKNKPVFVVEGGPRYSWALRELGLERRRGALGDGSGVERSFFKDINAGRSRTASLDMLMNIFFVYYNGPRFHEGIGRVPSEVMIAVVGRSPLSGQHQPGGSVTLSRSMIPDPRWTLRPVRNDG